MTYGRLLIAANGQDSISRGNRERGFSSGTGVMPNAIHSQSSRGIDFYAGHGGSLIFYDGIKGDEDSLRINKPNTAVHPAEGTVFFKDGASMDGFHTELYQGSLSMEEGTAIRGTVEARQASTAPEASAGFHVSLSGNWSAIADYHLETGNRQMDQSGRVGVMLEF